MLKYDEFLNEVVNTNKRLNNQSKKLYNLPTGGKPPVTRKPLVTTTGEKPPVTRKPPVTTTGEKPPVTTGEKEKGETTRRSGNRIKKENGVKPPEVNPVIPQTVNGKVVNGTEIVTKIKELITNLINKLKPTPIKTPIVPPTEASK